MSGNIKIIRAALCVLLPFASTPVASQIGSNGSRVKQNAAGVVVSIRDARHVRHAVGECIFRRHPADALAFLDNSDLMEMKAGSSLAGLGMDECLKDQIIENELELKLSNASIYAMLAEQAYLAANPKPPTWLSSAIILEQRRYFAIGDELERAQGLDTLVDCVVKAAPVRADALLRSPLGGGREMRAVKALEKPLEGCLFGGEHVSITPSVLRAWVAVGLWNAQTRQKSLSATRVVN